MRNEITPTDKPPFRGDFVPFGRANGGAAIAQMVEKTAKLFESGTYADRGVTVTDSDLDRLSSAFREVPVKIEHSQTPFDGALGTLTSIWRKGKELFGKLAFTAEAWALVEAAGAKKLSIAIKKDLSAITEVSLVTNPRVAGAAVFADRIEFVTEPHFTNGGHSQDDAYRAVLDIFGQEYADKWLASCRPTGSVNMTAPKPTAIPPEALEMWRKAGVNVEGASRYYREAKFGRPAQSVQSESERLALFAKMGVDPIAAEKRFQEIKFGATNQRRHGSTTVATFSAEQRDFLKRAGVDPDSAQKFYRG